MKRITHTVINTFETKNFTNETIGSLELLYGSFGPTILSDNRLGFLLERFYVLRIGRQVIESLREAL